MILTLITGSSENICAEDVLKIMSMNKQIYNRIDFNLFPTNKIF